MESRHLIPHNLHGAWGGDAYGRFAERVARSMGTATFLTVQTCFLILWITCNGILFAIGFHGLHWDPYPFILLNLMLSFQAAYSAPLILVAANRQAQRDQARELADMQHRQEEFSRIGVQVQQNTEITTEIRDLSQQISMLTQELHQHLMESIPEQ